jgi:hypothetical protein
MILVMLEILIIGLLTMVVGIIVVVIHDIVNDSRSSNNKGQAEGLSSELPHWEEPHEHSSLLAKADAGVLAVRRES